MNRKEIISLLVGTAFLLLIIFALVTSFMGVIPFLFSKKLVDYIGVFLIISVVCFTFLIFSLFEGREERINGKLRVAVKTVSVILSVVFIAVGIFITMFMREDLVKRSVSPDKDYELYIVRDDTFGGLDATLYKRRFASFKSRADSVYIEDMADFDGEVGVEWTDDGCKLSYEYYPDFETSEAQTSYRTLYFDGEQ